MTERRRSIAVRWRYYEKMCHLCSQGQPGGDREPTVQVENIFVIY